jgi:hypothetical protein
VQLAAATNEIDPSTSVPIGSGIAQSPTPARIANARPVAQPQQQNYAQPVPVYAGSQQQVPLAIGQARPVQYQGEAGGMPGGPVPMYSPGSGVGIAPARYDHPSMPGHAWPSYAANPNYAAVTYPKQYSPTAWPNIGQLYPYPQVPLGSRKVTHEWDDGWWMIDFKQRRSMYNHLAVRLRSTEPRPPRSSGFAGVFAFVNCHSPGRFSRSQALPGNASPRGSCLASESSGS